MLVLTREVLGAGSPPGVRAWRQRPGRGNGKVTVVAWPGLVLISPRLEWPEGGDPRRADGWPEGTRVVWVEGLGRFCFSRTPVPSLSTLLALRRCAGLRARPANLRGGKGPLPLLGRKGEVLGALPRVVFDRLVLGAGRPLRELDLRVFEVGGASTILAFNNETLRAVAALASIPPREP